MVAMNCLTDDASLELRLGLLLHDVGKPRTRSEDDKGVHFYEHQFVGAEMARVALHRLKLTNDQIHHVYELVRLHMRLGECSPNWSDAAVRRLIRDTAAHMDELFELSRCDMAAIDPDAPATDLVALRKRIDELNAQMNAATIVSPLDGVEIMELLGLQPGPAIRMGKDLLVNEVIEGRLGESDKEAAAVILRRWWAEQQ
jgi:poly(A) polymerase